MIEKVYFFLFVSLSFFRIWKLKKKKYRNLKTKIATSLDKVEKT